MQRVLVCLGSFCLICFAGCGDAALKEKVSALEKENQELKTKLDQALVKPDPKPDPKSAEPSLNNEQILDYLEGKPLVRKGDLADKAPLILKKAAIFGLRPGSWSGTLRYTFTYTSDNPKASGPFSPALNRYLVDVTIRPRNVNGKLAIDGLTIDGISQILVVIPGS